jgi:hypothetical protein
LRYAADDFQGLTPAVDPRRTNKLFALDGKNYVFDSFGPYSAFGNRYITPYPLGSPDQVQGMRLHLRSGDHVFLFTNDAIIEWSEQLGGWRVIYYFDVDIRLHPYRWTGDYLDGKMYFCHPAVGILAYDVGEDSCLPLESPGAPEEPIALCVCAGRVCVIDSTTFSWSAPGDGTLWTPQLGGAGFQVINERVAGFPVMVNSYGRGTLVWTTGGVMRSEFTADQAVWRHRPLVTEFRPINSFSTFRLDNDTIVLLDERGFFATQGETPQPLTPVFNEYLIDYLQRNNLKLGENCRVEFDDLQRRIYLSVSQSFSNPLYEKAFVLYQPLDKWGTFDEEHYGIFPLLIKDSSRADDYFGFTDSTGRVRYWHMGASREVLPTDSHLNSRYPLIQKPPVQRLNGDSIILSSSAVANTYDDTDVTQRAGYYGVAGLSPATANIVGLDSVCQLGLIRAAGDESYDRLSEISTIYIGSVFNAPFTNESELDTNPPPSIDGDTSGEDIGLEDVLYPNHGIRIIPTIDGRRPWVDPVIPELVFFDRAARTYSCSAVGLFHVFELNAQAAGEAYHVRSLELTVLDAGRFD